MAFLGPIGPVDIVHQLPGLTASLERITAKGQLIVDRFSKSIDAATQTARFALIVFSAAACLLVAVVSPGDIGKAALFLVAVGAGYWWVNEREQYWKDALERERNALEVKWAELAMMRGQFRRAVMEAALLGGRIGSATFTTLYPPFPHTPRTPTLLLASSWPSDRGSAFLHQPVDLHMGFVTEFAFRMSDGHGGMGGGGDGFAFVVQRERVEALGQGRGGLGYEGIRNGIALEFDTWRDPSPTADPTSNHISLHHPCTSSHISSIACTSRVPLLNSGKAFRCRVAYVHSEKNVRVYLLPPANEGAASDIVDDLSTTNTTSSVTEVPPLPPGGAWSRVLSAQADLPKLLGGRHAYVGFTASTNAAPQRHEVFLWTVWGGTDRMAEKEGEEGDDNEETSAIGAVVVQAGPRFRGDEKDVVKMDGRSRAGRRDDDDGFGSMYVDAPEAPATPGGIGGATVGGTSAGARRRVEGAQDAGRNGVSLGMGGDRTPQQEKVLPGGGGGAGGSPGLGSGASPSFPTGSRRTRGRDREREGAAGAGTGTVKEIGHVHGSAVGGGIGVGAGDDDVGERNGPLGDDPSRGRASGARSGNSSPHHTSSSWDMDSLRRTGESTGQTQAGGESVGPTTRERDPDRQRPELSVLGVGSIGGVS
ncbi:hypothetical protein HDU93_001657 [Gonapodya sp. JEL0774]|nr:hypothetical protein HDU93_001657 [Gonapodya sp. JEL0774]